MYSAVILNNKVSPTFIHDLSSFVFAVDSTMSTSESSAVSPTETKNSYNTKPVEVLKNYINGEWTTPGSGEYLDNVSPATGVVIAKVPRSTSKDVDAAVKAAEAALVEWRKLSERERADYLDKISKAIHENLDELAEVESYDTGKSLSLAKTMDIPRARDNFAFFAGQIRHDFTEAHSISGGPQASLSYTQRTPVGVAGLITPWNLPMYLLSWKVAPAIGCGNTVVAKPSELTPLTADRLAKLCEKVGLPKGVFNVVHGTGAVAGQALVAHKDIPLISFTGGTATGAIVNTTAAPLFKKVSLELGGKNSTVVFDDVDVDAIVPTVLRASFANQGQICLCGSRLFVHEKVYDAFVPKFVAAVQQQLKADDPRVSTFGALISSAHRAKIESYVSLAIADGGKVLCGGKRPSLPAPFDGGFFYEVCQTRPLFLPVCRLTRGFSSCLSCPCMMLDCPLSIHLLYSFVVFISPLSVTSPFSLLLPSLSSLFPVPFSPPSLKAFPPHPAAHKRKSSVLSLSSTSFLPKMRR